MEPWLDSLSDEWASNKQSSSPGNPSLTPESRASSRARNHSSSRIPHLSQNHSQSSRDGSFLRPRSSKGLARSQNSPVLAERTSSRLNVVAQKANVAGPSTIPRKVSSAFSGSVNSVQHHTLPHRSGLGDENTPEWKRRLAHGEDIGSEGCDLFGPTRLEGIFKQPPPSRMGVESNPPSIARSAKPWSMPEQYQSMRASKSRIPELGVLTEEDEEEAKNDTSNASGDSSTKRKLRGVVKDRVLSLEHSSIFSSPSYSRSESRQRDLRMGTSSGIEEIQNEEISPITTSRQNTIREQALRRLTEVPIRALHSRLEDIVERPTSRSSDDGVLYGHEDNKGEEVGEITSLSLPDDLSMGTQDFVSRGGFVNSRRGGRSTEDSFQKKPLRSSLPCSLEQSVVEHQNLAFRSSPPPYTTTSRSVQVRPAPTVISPATPQEEQPSDSTDRPRSSGSPLKLFGTYDTFTNNRLLRRMGQFEDMDEDDRGQSEETPVALGNMETMRISHFGEGQLDQFTFDERVETKPVLSSSRPENSVRIFGSPNTREGKPQGYNATQGSTLDAGEGSEQVT